MGYILIAMLFVSSYLFFETINLVAENKENMTVKRIMFAVTSACITGTLFYFGTLLWIRLNE